jgi:hypothetical protein
LDETDYAAAIKITDTGTGTPKIMPAAFARESDYIVALRQPDD